jgi:hypothetical protein
MSNSYEISKHPILRELTQARKSLDAMCFIGLENTDEVGPHFESLCAHLGESLEQVSLLMHAIVQHDARLFTGIVGYPIGIELADAIKKRHEVIFDKHTQQPSDR